MQNVELLTAETLLENGVQLGVDAPRFFRLFGLKKLKLYQPSCGNRIRISKIYLEMNISESLLSEVSALEAELLLQKHTYAHCRIIAIAMLKGYLMPLLFHRIIARWLMWKLNHSRAMAIAQAILTLSGTKAFMITTRFINQMNILGQQVKKRS